MGWQEEQHVGNKLQGPGTCYNASLCSQVAEWTRHLTRTHTRGSTLLHLAVSVRPNSLRHRKETLCIRLKLLHVVIH